MAYLTQKLESADPIGRGAFSLLLPSATQFHQVMWNDDIPSHTEGWLPDPAEPLAFH